MNENIIFYFCSLGIINFFIHFNQLGDQSHYMIEDLHNVLKGAQALNNVFAAINVFSSISKIFSDYMSRYTLKFDS